MTIENRLRRLLYSDSGPMKSDKEYEDDILDEPTEVDEPEESDSADSQETSDSTMQAREKLEALFGEKSDGDIDELPDELKENLERFNNHQYLFKPFSVPVVEITFSSYNGTIWRENARTEQGENINTDGSTIDWETLNAISHRVSSDDTLDLTLHTENGGGVPAERYEEYSVEVIGYREGLYVLERSPAPETFTSWEESARYWYCPLYESDEEVTKEDILVGLFSETSPGDLQTTEKVEASPSDSNSKK